MKFSIGYQLRKDDLFITAVLENARQLSEVYFALPQFANGRGTAWCKAAFCTAAEQQNKQLSDLDRLKNAGLKTNLLLNGNCYGEKTLAADFYDDIGNAVQLLQTTLGLNAVTTASPTIAKFLKQHFPGLEVRASVNMNLAEPQAFEYIADLFDSFYFSRNQNRSLSAITKAKKWCDSHGKQLYGLANSGCLNHCPAHTFHDNLVAHEAQIAKQNNALQFEGQCFTYLQSKANRANWLCYTNFIRPEDVALYEDLFCGLKLATRMAANPARIINAYCRGRYSGPVQELLEPNHSGMFYPYIIENKNFPQNFGRHTLQCNKSCADCNYCKTALQSAAIKLF